MVDGRFEKVEGTDFELAVRARAAGHGLRRPAAPGPARAARRRAQRARQRRPRRRATQRRPACSWPATWAAARASSCGPSPRAAACAAAVDRHLMGETALPAPDRPRRRPPAVARSPEGVTVRCRSAVDQSPAATTMPSTRWTGKLHPGVPVRRRLRVAGRDATALMAQPSSVSITSPNGIAVRKMSSRSTSAMNEFIQPSRAVRIEDGEEDAHGVEVGVAGDPVVDARAPRRRAHVDDVDGERSSGRRRLFAGSGWTVSRRRPAAAQLVDGARRRRLSPPLVDCIEDVDRDRAVGQIRRQSARGSPARRPPPGPST